MSFVAFVAALEMLDDGLRLAAHVSVGGSLLIDGVAQFQAVFYCLGAKVEQLVNLTGNLTVAHIDVAAAMVSTKY